MEMNPFAKVEFTQDLNLEKLLNDQLVQISEFSAIAYCQRTFREAIQINVSARKFNVPFYCLNSSGLYGYFFIDVG